MFDESMLVIWKWGIFSFVWVFLIYGYWRQNLWMAFKPVKSWVYDIVAIPTGIMLIVGYILVQILWTFN